MQRGIDHLVLCVNDLDDARRTYGSLGFTTTPQTQHPFGTANSLVQLQGNFPELLTIAEPDKIPPQTTDRFSFGAFNADFLAARQGLSMLVFQSDDARRDWDEFQDKGLRTYQPFDFSRQATLPDGSQATVSFSTVFVTDPRMPDIAYFVCQQHAPQYFWKPEYQRHANGAQAIAEVLMAASQPASFADFFAAIQSPEQVSVDSGELLVDTALGRIRALSPERYLRRFPRQRRDGSRSRRTLRHAGSM